MKTDSAIPCTVILLTLSLAGCDQRQGNLTSSNGAGSPGAASHQSAVSAVAANAIQAGDPVAGTLDEVKTLTYETRNNLPPITDKMDRQVNALIARWVAAGRQFPDETEEQYRKSRKILTEKLNALTFASPETWNNAKNEATVALQNVRGALHALDTSAT